MRFLPLLFLIQVSCATNSFVTNDKKPASTSCSVEKQIGCNKNEVCMNTAVNIASCREVVAAPNNTFLLPFDKNTTVVCTHSFGDGSHSWPNAFYALDLATDYKKPPSIVRASAPGKIFLSQGKNGKLCPEPKGSPEKTETDQCGNGWGNSIKILHADGYFSFYVHLKKFLVKNGQMVKAGQPIGIEGSTGLAGHRHLHWSIQKATGSTPMEWESQMQWDGESIPFFFEANINGENLTVDASQFICPHANIGKANQQPQLSGVISP